MRRFGWWAFFGCLLSAPCSGQTSFFSVPDSLHKNRLRVGLVAGTCAWSASMTGLYKTWYSDYPSAPFHTFNDNQEWLQMDKAGHILMSFQESRWVYAAARWTGIQPSKAAWLGFAGGQFIQTSLETFDGFSAEWGWSWGDIAANWIGGGAFLAQQIVWKEQRIHFKMSGRDPKPDDLPIYPYTPAGNHTATTLSRRSADLYGTGPMNFFLKNYNTLAVWISVNPSSFFSNKKSFLPPWLNFAIGMGADNLYAGRGYEWTSDKACIGPDCIRYRLDPEIYPRQRQWMLSLDVDLTKIPVRKPWLKALLGAANIFKIPSPALEWRSGRGLKMYAFYF